jgi:hypothetical protein
VILIYKIERRNSRVPSGGDFVRRTARRPYLAGRSFREQAQRESPFPSHYGRRQRQLGGHFQPLS